jgi:hypothetical protein
MWHPCVVSDLSGLPTSDSKPMPDSNGLFDAPPRGPWIVGEHRAQSLAATVHSSGRLEHAQPSGTLDVFRIGPIQVIEADGLFVDQITPGLCHQGAIEYEAVAAAIDAAAIDPDVRGLLLVVESAGGCLAGLDRLRSSIICAQLNFPMFSLMREVCQGAAIAIATAAQRVYCTRQLLSSGQVHSWILSEAGLAVPEGAGAEDLSRRVAHDRRLPLDRVRSLLSQYEPTPLDLRTGGIVDDFINLGDSRSIATTMAAR